jgi:NADH-quinone oxidoreductase subunit K
MSLWFTFSETLNVYTWCASLFFVVGACGVMYSSQSFLITAINIELLYLGATLTVIFASLETFSIYPQLFGLLLVVVAACEAVVGLGLLISLYHAQGTIAFQPYAKLFSVFLVSTSLAFTNNCTSTNLQVDYFA